jgi:hypothetical protein
MRTPKQLSEALADEMTTVARDLIKLENELQSTRTTWLLQTNGLLFAALGFACDKAPWQLVALLAATGILVSASIYRALRLHHLAIDEIRAWWAAWLTDEQPAARRIIGLWNPSDRALMERLFRPWRFLPRLFAYAWLAVLAIRLFVPR